jgi:hypothetical protein
MPVIHVVDKTHLAERKISFLGCPSLAIPVLEKTYYAKFSWFTSMDALIAEMTKRKPLIVLDSPADKGVTADKIPANLRASPEVFCIRAWDSLPERDWSIVRNNICETDNHNFTFKWNTANFSDPVILAAQSRKDKEALRAREYDKKELEEYATMHKMSGKRHPLLST